MSRHFGKSRPVVIAHERLFVMLKRCDSVADSIVWMEEGMFRSLVCVWEHCVSQALFFGERENV